MVSQVSEEISQVITLVSFRDLCSFAFFSRRKNRGFRRFFFGGVVENLTILSFSAWQARCKEKFQIGCIHGKHCKCIWICFHQLGTHDAKIFDHLLDHFLLICKLKFMQGPKAALRFVSSYMVMYIWWVHCFWTRRSGTDQHGKHCHPIAGDQQLLLER